MYRWNSAAQFLRGLDPAPWNAEDRRREGIGAALLTTVTGAFAGRTCRHCTSHRLDEKSTGDQALRETGILSGKTVPAYFGQGEDRIIMKKTLNGR